ncbi:hypothetical protein N9Z27_02880 [Alphaproteobacteria bacterium]|nr:hypothetical protein [Alphaproteobacteria bacterium]
MDNEPQDSGIDLITIDLIEGAAGTHIGEKSSTIKTPSAVFQQSASPQNQKQNIPEEPVPLEDLAQYRSNVAHAVRQLATASNLENALCNILEEIDEFKRITIEVLKQHPDSIKEIKKELKEVAEILKKAGFKPENLTSILDQNPSERSRQLLSNYTYHLLKGRLLSGIHAHLTEAHILNAKKTQQTPTASAHEPPTSDIN